MTDKEFLYWLSHRLIEVCGEDPDANFIRRLRAIARSLSLFDPYYYKYPFHQ